MKSNPILIDDGTKQVPAKVAFAVVCLSSTEPVPREEDEKHGESSYIYMQQRVCECVRWEIRREMWRNKKCGATAPSAASKKRMSSTLLALRPLGRSRVRVRVRVRILLSQKRI